MIIRNDCRVQLRDLLDDKLSGLGRLRVKLHTDYPTYTLDVSGFQVDIVFLNTESSDEVPEAKILVRTETDKATFGAKGAAQLERMVYDAVSLIYMLYITHTGKLMITAQEQLYAHTNRYLACVRGQTDAAEPSDEQT